MNAEHPRSGAASPEVLLVASSSVEQLVRAEKVVSRQIAGGARIHFLLSGKQELVANHLVSSGASISHYPDGKLALLKWLLDFRKRPFRKVVVLLTGERWHSSLKMIGLLLAVGRGLILNENGDYCRPTPLTLYRHVRWRLSQQSARSRHLAHSAWRIYRREGLRPMLRRITLRVPTSGRVTSNLRVATLLGFRRIRLSASDDPEVSIVIPVFNHWRFTYRCLASIAIDTQGVPYEVIVVDNASTDRTRKIGKWASGVRVVRLAENCGFVEACKRGADAARGDKILFLNNDTVVTDGWVQALASISLRRPDWGAVGGKLLFPNGKLQEAGGIVWKDGSAWNYGKFDDPDRPEYNYVREVDYCSAACLLVRRSAFEEVGGFDLRYSPGYWEDADLCFALRRAGYSVWYQPACVVYHHEGASSGTDPTQGMKRFQARHHEPFRRKWAQEIGSQTSFRVEALFRARDRANIATVVVFDHYVPTPDRDAGSAFMYWFLKTLAGMGYRVLLWPDNLFRTPAYAEALQQEGIEVLYGALAVSDYFGAFGDFIDAVIAYRSPVAMKYLPLTRRFVRSQAYVAVDLEHLREERRREAERDEDSRVAELRARESRLVSLSDCVGVHSPVEQRILEREFGAQSVVHLPLPVPPLPVTEAPFENRSGLLFVGSTHPPNVDGILHFVRNVLPLIRQQLPDLELRIVGDVCNQIRELQREPGVHLIGFAADLQPYFEQARVFIAPLRYGAGIKGKILSAMSAGVPVVTTPIGAEGIEIDPSCSAFVEDSDEGFASAVHRLYNNGDTWRSVRDKARCLIDHQFSAESFESSVARLMSEMGVTPTKRDDLPRADGVARAPTL